MERVRKGLAGLVVAVLAAACPSAVAPADAPAGARADRPAGARDEAPVDAPSDVRTNCKARRHHFVTRPDLGAVPGACVVTPANGTAEGKIFLAYQDGPVMLNDSGEVVWYRPGERTDTTNFRVVRYRGQKLLVYYRGYYVPAHRGTGQTEFVLLNKHYEEVATVHAVGGYRADLHEFTVTPQGTALIGSYVPVIVDLSEHGGTSGTTVYDYVVQEIDIATNELLWEWRALDHIPITESVVPPPTNGGSSYAWFHGNAIEVANDGNLLISARNTFAIYKIDRDTGEVIWKLGGEDNSFPTLRAGQGVSSEEAYWFCWQHDIRQLDDGTYTLFDNGDGPGESCGPSRGLRLALDPETGTGTILDVYRHDPDIRSSFLGGMQTLPDGNKLVQWGNIRQVTEYHRDGSVALDLKLTDMSYRAFRFEWHGYPTQTPAVAWRDDGDGSVSIYVSWNGATEVARWQLRAGKSVTTLHDVGAPQPKDGFETRLSLPQPAHVMRVQALGADGEVLGTSPVMVYR